MVVVEQLAAELEVQLAAETPAPLVDVFGLELQVPLAIKTKVSHERPAYLLARSTLATVRGSSCRPVGPIWISVFISGQTPQS